MGSAQSWDLSGSPICQRPSPTYRNCKGCSRFFDDQLVFLGRLWTNARDSSAAREDSWLNELADVLDAALSDSVEEYPARPGVPYLGSTVQFSKVNNMKPSNRGVLWIKAHVLLNLTLGFAVAIAVPRLAISKLGLETYGAYALIAGFAGLLAFADLGLPPGLIRALAGPLARDDSYVVRSTMVRAARTVFSTWVALLAFCWGLLWFSTGQAAGQTFHALVVFSLASLFASGAVLIAAVLGSAGRIVFTYGARSAYLIVYLLCILAAYAAMPQWPGVVVICYAQLFAAVAFFVILLREAQHLVAGTRAGPLELGEAHRLWPTVWQLSAPDRFNRFIHLVASAVERPLLFATMGSAFVGSYDLLLRVSLLVSALPSGLVQPLLAMISHDQARPGDQTRFAGAERSTRGVVAGLAVLGLAGSTVLWTGFHVDIFGVETSIQNPLGLLVLVTTAINVMTGPGVAMCIARREPAPVNRKLQIEMAGVLVGAVVALSTGNGQSFIVIRYVALLVSAIFLLRVDHKHRARAG